MRGKSWDILKRLFDMSLWQQVVAGLIVVAILVAIRWLGQQIAAMAITPAIWVEIGWLGREVLADLIAAALLVLIGLVWRMFTHLAPWSYDFIEHFSEAQCSVRDPEYTKTGKICCGGRPKMAIYQHPPLEGESVIRYYVLMPQMVGTVRLECFIGIKDDSAIDRDPSNVVHFEVRVAGSRIVLSENYAQKRWVRPNSDLIMPSEASEGIEFATDALGNPQWNWAAWGEPKLVEVK